MFIRDWWIIAARKGVNMIKRTLLLLLAVAAPIWAQQNPDWHRELPAFKIAGNLYWVGTADLAVYLINTPQGNILINSDFPEDVPLSKRSIEQLGSKSASTKIIHATHDNRDPD